MSVDLHLNGQVCPAEKGDTLFDRAEALGVRVPTSCRKLGKCKECIVEVTEGMDCLTPRADTEKHLAGNYRLSCCTRIAKAQGEVRFHTMRRGAMVIEKHAFELPTGAR
ncbi:MAG: 2Fe-2S iron-sulfur cluster binding domain-containing protein, partial [Verrucomicrobia bacterium]|nr:2Fe-2S iron-sulfur cluster binding domain-containing protein [Verrucomicrobiota bacterium]